MASTTLVVPSRMKVNYNLEVLGNLIVKGNTTYLDTDVFRVDDAMIVLANNQTAANMDAGFMVQRGSSNNAVFYWDESSDTWTCATSSSNHDSVKPDAPDIGNSTNAGFTAALITASGRLITDDTTDASSKTDGALQTDGGLSVAKSAVIGDDLDLLSDGAIFAMGAGQDVTITHDGTSGATLNSADDFLLSAGGTEVARIDVSATSLLMSAAKKIEFRDAALTVYSSADGQLDIDADTELEITTTTVDMNAACSISGITTIEDTTASSTAANGALIVKGGVGIAADLTVGDDIRLLSDSAVLALGAGNDVTITHDGATGATLNSAGDFLLSAGGTEVARVDVSATCILMAGTKQIRFSDDATYIQRNGATLRIENDTQNNAAAIDIRANTGGITLKAAGTTTGQVDIATANGTTKGSVKITPKAAYGHIDFSGTEATTSGASVFDIDSAGTMTMAKFVKIAVNDAVYYLPAYAAS